MPKDKFTAVWVSHSSMSDFLKCPRAYYLKNMYKDPETGHKVQVMAPPLALGAAVHEVIESLSVIPTADRFKESLLVKFERAWSKYTGKRGGFTNPESEARYKKRGEDMIRRVMNNPGPVANLAIKIQQDLPSYWLSEDDNIILCGKIDWLEYFPETDSVHIIDFKTSKAEEDGASLQLPIYYLLVHNTQKRKVVKASYWYLELSDTLTEKHLPDLEEAHNQVLQTAKRVKLARQLNQFKCPQGENGCYCCRPMEKILRGEAEKVGINEYNQDIYIVPSTTEQEGDDSVIL